MLEPAITCPQCNIEIKLTESLAAPLIQATRREFEIRLAQKDADIAKKEAMLRDREAAIARAREQIDQELAAKLLQERGKIAAEEARKAKLSLATDLEQKAKAIAELQEVLKERDIKLAEAQKSQAEVLRKQRELDDPKREVELTIEKRVQESLAATREQARKETEEELKFKVLEKEQTISSMQRQIEELKRRAEQGSQQLQGEVQELELENLLRTKFPRDSIQPVPKGEFGGDVLHRVNGTLGQSCGFILWECKRTKNWSDGWLAKLREDQRTAKAEIAVIVSQALPKDVETFEFVEGVWVTHPRAAVPVAVVLRQTLLEVAAVRQSSEGQQTKMEMVYQYLTGQRFRQRVQAIVEAFSCMREDLDREKRAIIKQWAKREEQIERVMEATVGMYGDLQGIAGKTLQEIEGLEFPALDQPNIEQGDLWGREKINRSAVLLIRPVIVWSAAAPARQEPGTSARRKTLSVTLPINMWASPVRPWVDITMMSTPSASALSTIRLYGVPISTSCRTLVFRLDQRNFSEMKSFNSFFLVPKIFLASAIRFAGKPILPCLGEKEFPRP